MATEPAPVPPAELGFSAAAAELDRIVAELEQGALDVDALTDRVARAAELVAWCRGQLDGTRLQVEEVLATLEQAGGEADDA